MSYFVIHNILNLLHIKLQREKMAARRICSNPESCKEKIVLFNDIKAKNTKLEREIKENRANATSMLRIAHEGHTRDMKALSVQNAAEMKTMQQACFINITKSLNSCNKLTRQNHKAITKQITDFGKVMGKKDDFITKLQGDKNKLHVKLQECGKSASDNMANIIKQHASEKEKLLKEKLNQKHEIEKYVTSTHVLAKNIQDISRDHMALQKNHSAVSQNLLKCHNTIEMQKGNMSHINSTIGLMDRLYRTLEKKEELCQQMLGNYVSSSPVQEERIAQLLTLHQRSQIEAGVCIRQKTEMNKKLINCQQKTINHNFEVYNLTNSNNIIAMLYELSHEANVSCHVEKVSHVKTIEKMKSENTRLASSNSDLEAQVLALTNTLEETNIKFDNLTKDFHNLQRDFKVQEETIQQLLEEEKAKNEFFLTKEAECANAKLDKINQLKDLEYYTSRYWQAKKALGSCLMLSPVFNGSWSVQYTTPLQRQFAELAKEQNVHLIECMQSYEHNITLETNNNKTHLTEYTLADFEQMIQLVKNEIPIGNSRATYLKTCEDALRGVNLTMMTYPPKKPSSITIPTTTTPTTATTTTEIQNNNLPQENAAKPEPEEEKMELDSEKSTQEMDTTPAPK